MCVFVYSARIIWRMKSPDTVLMIAIFFRRVQNVVVSTRSVSTGVIPELYELCSQGSALLLKLFLSV